MKPSELTQRAAKLLRSHVYLPDLLAAAQAVDVSLRGLQENRRLSSRQVLVDVLNERLNRLEVEVEKAEAKPEIRAMILSGF
jgi:hypothetical protein